MQTAGGTPQANVLRIGRVVKSYPDKHVVDVVFLDDGGFASGVGLSTLWGSQTHGIHYMTEIAEPADGHWSPELSNKNDALALVGYFSGQPFVVGMVFPAANAQAKMNKLPLNTLLIQSIANASLEIDPLGNVTIISSGGATIRAGKDGNIYLN